MRRAVRRVDTRVVRAVRNGRGDRAVFGVCDAVAALERPDDGTFGGRRYLYQRGTLAGDIVAARRLYRLTAVNEAVATVRPSAAHEIERVGMRPQPCFRVDTVYHRSDGGTDRGDVAQVFVPRGRRRFRYGRSISRARCGVPVRAFLL